MDKSRGKEREFHLHNKEGIHPDSECDDNRAVEADDYE